MTRLSSFVTALCAATAIPAAAEGAPVAPEWVHLLPAGEIRTHDGRGPYKADLQAVAEASMKINDRLPIDECHSIDKAAPEGRPAPARGWIVELEARDDGLWGRVEWTPTGQQLMAEKAYRGISPVIAHRKDNVVLGVLRASLINTPNLVGLASLHSEEPQSMDWKAKLIELLGLDSEADDAAILAALKAKMEAPATSEHGALTNPAVVALQGQLSDMTTRFNTLNESVSRDKATAFVDAAIAAGHIGVRPLREDYIAMHMADPAHAAKMIGGLPKVPGSTHAANVAPETESGDLDAGDRQVIQLMGLDEEAYRVAAGKPKKEAL